MVRESGFSSIFHYFGKFLFPCLLPDELLQMPILSALIVIAPAHLQQEIFKPARLRCRIRS
jgi:hypothetical protein